MRRANSVPPNGASSRSSANLASNRRRRCRAERATRRRGRDRSAGGRECRRLAGLVADEVGQESDGDDEDRRDDRAVGRHPRAIFADRLLEYRWPVRLIHVPPPARSPSLEGDPRGCQQPSVTLSPDRGTEYAAGATSRRVSAPGRSRPPHAPRRRLDAVPAARVGAAHRRLPRPARGLVGLLGHLTMRARQRVQLHGLREALEQLRPP